MHPLASRVIQRETRAVARALTIIENDLPDKQALLDSFYAYAGRAHIVGFTGSPGAGKSTLVDQLITYLRREGKLIGVLAVDPSSPFTGGALLGDRVRMTEHSSDPGVYIRSIGSRGSLGGLGKSTRDMLVALEAYGCDVVILETVGVGQSELDVLTVADSVGLLLTPGAGDSVQTAKAGIMEIADVFVVNKRDLPGSDALRREIQLMLHEKREHRENWEPPICATNAMEGQGIAELWQALVQHRIHLKDSGYGVLRRQAQAQEATLQLIENQFRVYLERQLEIDETWREIFLASDALSPYQRAELLLEKMSWLKL